MTDSIKGAVEEAQERQRVLEHERVSAQIREALDPHVRLAQVERLLERAQERRISAERERDALERRHMELVNAIWALAKPSANPPIRALRELVLAAKSGVDDGLCPECAHRPPAMALCDRCWLLEWIRRARQALALAEYRDTRLAAANYRFDEAEARLALAEQPATMAERLRNAGYTVTEPEKGSD